MALVDETVVLGDRPVHRIGFGAMQLPGPGVFGPPRDREVAIAVDEQLDAMVAMRDEGLIGAVGVSNVDVEQFAAVTDRTAVACVQNPYNLADRSAEPLLAACTAQRVPFVPFFPLGSAFASDNPVLGAPAATEVAGRLGATPAQVALAWLLGRSPQLLLIPGTSSRAHLEENLAAADLHLDEEDRARLDAAGTA